MVLVHRLAGAIGEDRPSSVVAGEERMQGLEGIRVLELGEGVSAAYATKLLADLGALPFNLITNDLSTALRQFLQRCD